MKKTPIYPLSSPKSQQTHGKINIRLLLISAVTAFSMGTLYAADELGDSESPKSHVSPSSSVPKEESQQSLEALQKLYAELFAQNQDLRVQVSFFDDKFRQQVEEHRHEFEKFARHVEELNHGAPRWREDLHALRSEYAYLTGSNVKEKSYGGLPPVSSSNSYYDAVGYEQPYSSHFEIQGPLAYKPQSKRLTKEELSRVDPMYLDYLSVELPSAINQGAVYGYFDNAGGAGEAMYIRGYLLDLKINGQAPLDVILNEEKKGDRQAPGTSEVGDKLLDIDKYVELLSEYIDGRTQY